MAIKREVIQATIPNAGTDSGTVTVPLNKALLGFRIPSAFTGTSVSFKAGLAASDTLRPIYNGGTLFSISVAADRFYYLSPEVTRGCNYLSIVSGSAEGAARVVDLVFGEV